MSQSMSEIKTIYSVVYLKEDNIRGSWIAVSGKRDFSKAERGVGKVSEAPEGAFTTEIPEQMEKREAFIQKAIQLSEKEHLDTVIEEEEEGISVSYFFDKPKSVDFWPEALELLNMVEDVYFYEATENRDIGIALFFRTHTLN